MTGLRFADTNIVLCSIGKDSGQYPCSQNMRLGIRSVWASCLTPYGPRHTLRMARPMFHDKECLTEPGGLLRMSCRSFAPVFSIPYASRRQQT